MKTMSGKKLSSCLIAGGGTAGLIAALTLKIKCPQIQVTLVRSKAMGVIGVGEGTYFGINPFLFNYLNLDRNQFYQQAKPTWKLGIKFSWGETFNYTFQNEYDRHESTHDYPNGFYNMLDTQNAGLSSALMDANHVFLKDSQGQPIIVENVVYHLENKTFVAYLEAQAENLKINLLDDVIQEVETDDTGIRSLHLAKHGKVTAGLYVDSTGFSSLLLEKNLSVPFESFHSTLFCDKAVVGGWHRTEEPIQPYTCSNAMSSGWEWRIDHEDLINKGYVFSSSFIDDADAETEFVRKNPMIKDTRIINFKPGVHQRAWYKNVIAIGNAYGFVEPLEATSIGLICSQSRLLVDCLLSCDYKPDEFVQQIHNQKTGDKWSRVRYFLGLHYFLNQKSQGPFWDACRKDIELDNLNEMIDTYQRYGPERTFLRTYLHKEDIFGLNGYLTMLLGFKTPCKKKVSLSKQDPHQAKMSAQANYMRANYKSLSSEETLKIIRGPSWTWEQQLGKAS